MGKALLRAAGRLGRAAVAIALAVTVTAAVSWLAPGRFSDEMRIDPSLAPETIAVAAHRDSAPATAVAAWAAGLVHGDLGTSLASGVPVAPLLARRARVTAALSVPALLATWVLAFVLAAVSLTRQRLRSAFLAGAGLVQSVPDAVVALALVRFSVATGWFPVGGLGDPSSAGLAMGDVRYVLLPLAALVVVQTPSIARLTLEVLAEQQARTFVSASAARGLHAPQRFWRHTVRAALPQLIAVAGATTGALLAGSVMVEVVFAWPGLGSLLVDAVLARDLPVVLGAVTLTTAVVAGARGGADLLRAVADPRVRG